MNLEEYAALHPETQQAPEEQQASTAKSLFERKEEIEEADRLKESILQQLQEGNAPEFILYPAIKAIGLLSADREWTEAARLILDKLYGDMAQKSLFVDEVAVKGRRLEALRKEYAAKNINGVKRALKGCERLDMLLRQAIVEIEELEGQ